MNRVPNSKAVVVAFLAALSTQCLAVMAGESLESKEGEAKELLASKAEVVVYKRAGGKDLKLYLFKPEERNAGAASPAIVFFHGGAWKTGAPFKHAFDCHYLAKRGMAAMTVQYRLSADGTSTPFDSVEDARSAMRYVRSHAKELGIDPKRIAAGGASAGGHLAACAAFLEGPNAKDDDLATSPKPDALVLFCPVIDLTREGYRKGNELLGERALELSPAQHAGANAPPTFIAAGTLDGSSPIAALRRFKARAEAEGGRCELAEYEGGKHGFNGGMEFYADVVWRMDRFLESIGFLKGEKSLDAVKADVRTVLEAGKPRS